MVAKRMSWFLILPALGLVLGGLAAGIYAQGTPKTPPGQPKTVAQPLAAMQDRAADRAAIRTALNSFVAAFEKGDATAAAAHMTAGAEMLTPDGQTVLGRDAIQAGYAKYFAKYPKHTVKVEQQSLHFTSRDTALEEGNMTVTRDKEEPGFYRYVVLYVREDGKWQIAVLRNDTNDQAALHDLDWLIGTWESKGTDVSAQTTYEWVGDKAFIQSHFTIQEKDKSLTGTQMIGVDPNTGDLRTWTFEADGGFGQGSCTRDGNKWVFAMSATLVDGRTMTSTNILTPVDHDTFVWQPVDLTIDDEPIGNLPPVKVTRVKGK